MKTSTYNWISNKVPYFIIVCLVFISIQLMGQTTHSVTVGNNFFEPKDLTINVGDIVEWTNSSGNHNVNGTTSTFPDNPQSFGNDLGTNWTYSFTFSVAGEYDYQCDPHIPGMVGTVTVQSAASISEKFSSETKVYPNPAREVVYIEINNVSGKNVKVSITDLSGRKVLKDSFTLKAVNRIDVSKLEAGNYLLQFSIDGKEGRKSILIQ